MNNLLMMMKKSIKPLMSLPSPSNISYWWNMGSLLSLFLVIQIFSGFFLSFHYCPNIYLAFPSIIHMIQNLSKGWLMHNIHMNGASFFFFFMYLHISRGIYYMSFKLMFTWLLGITILLASMLTAFLGYVLPWGQMSYWGATVITSLMSSIPYLGSSLVMWIWGGFAINNATLNRFFSLHFILPFMLIILIFLHLFFLHTTGSLNPLGTNSDLNKIPFHPYFSYKDLLGFMLILFFFNIIFLQFPYTLSDPDNFILANPLMTPSHIQPEWYFLFAYAILRSIPNKLGGVLALLMSILILYYMPLMNLISLPLPFNLFSQLLFWCFINNFIILTWLGSQLIEAPFMIMSQMMSFIHFLFFLLLPFMNKMWNKQMNIY